MDDQSMKDPEAGSMSIARITIKCISTTLNWEWLNLTKVKNDEVWNEFNKKNLSKHFFRNKKHLE